MTTSTASDRTEVGNYFIANYPPFSVWKKEAVETDARPALAAPPGRRPARPLPAHPVLPEAVPLLLLPRLHRQERGGGAGLPRRAGPRMGALQHRSPRLPGARSISCISAAARRPTFRPRSSRASSGGWTPSARGVRRRRSPSSASRGRSTRASCARSRTSASPGSASASRTSTTPSSRRTDGRIDPVKSGALTSTRSRSASRRSTSISSPACWARPTRTGRAACGGRSTWRPTASPSIRWSCRSTRRSARTS